MADFCRQCSVVVFGEDFKDLADLGPPLGPNLGYIALCEGCGPTLVTHEGTCILNGCKEHKVHQSG